MEKLITSLYQVLEKLVGLHRQLLENVRLERKALVDADLKAIQEATFAKEALIESVKQSENLRARLIAELAIIIKKPVRDLTLPNVIIYIQGFDLKRADQFRSALNALSLLVERIRDQNEGNRALLERSLEHVNEMKRNILGQAVPKSDTYSDLGQKVSNTSGARLISKEV